jgi:hypothetical protein
LPSGSPFFQSRYQFGTGFVKNQPKGIDMAKMKAPENCGGCYVGGVEYTADKKGFINVPDEFIDALLPHGYTLAGDSVKPAVDDAPSVDAAPAAAE